MTRCLLSDGRYDYPFLETCQVSETCIIVLAPVLKLPTRAETYSDPKQRGTWLYLRSIVSEVTGVNQPS
jgi:hypothetical protein